MLVETNVTKVCNVCNQEKEIGDFYFRKDHNRYRNECKACLILAVEKRKVDNPERFNDIRQRTTVKNKDKIDKWQKEYRVANGKMLSEKSKRYRNINKEAYDITKKKYYLKNRDKALDDKRKWYIANKEKHAANRTKYELENKDRLREARRKWENERLRTDINYKLQKLLCKRVRNALKDCGLKKQQATEELVGCSVDELKLHIESKFKVGMTWDNHGKVWDIDHCIPISWFNLENENCRKLAFSFRNMQPLTKRENSIKKNFYHHPIHV